MEPVCASRVGTPKAAASIILLNISFTFYAVAQKLVPELKKNTRLAATVRRSTQPFCPRFPILIHWEIVYGHKLWVIALYQIGLCGVYPAIKVLIFNDIGNAFREMPGSGRIEDRGRKSSHFLRELMERATGLARKFMTP